LDCPVGTVLVLIFINVQPLRYLSMHLKFV
jgi:hypothetical protein